MNRRNMLMTKSYPWMMNQKGFSLTELLVVLIICGIVVAGIYRVFVAQTKAYVVQDQVVEVQQGIRSAMEIILRDLRMTGFDDDSPPSKIAVTRPLVPGDHSVTISYEYDHTTCHTIAYTRDGSALRLTRRLTITKDDGKVVIEPVEVLLENVDALNFTFGVDIDDDGFVDNWVPSAGIGMSKVVAIRVVLTARPVQVNPDLTVISPRTLESTVVLRNLCMVK